MTPISRSAAEQGNAAERQFQDVDLAIVAESTYPYLRGGVSAVIDDIIRANLEGWSRQIRLRVMRVESRSDAVARSSVFTPRSSNQDVRFSPHLAQAGPVGVWVGRGAVLLRFVRWACMRRCSASSVLCR